jgi:hypothetical protein
MVTAKDIRTWKAIRVFSGRIVTGPKDLRMVAKRSWSARMALGLPVK